MKKTFMLLVIVLLTGCRTEKAPKADLSLELAQRFCLKSNSECLNILSFDFDKAFTEGQNDSKSPLKWSVLVSRRTEKLENLCDKAPDVKVCRDYRDTLLTAYMVGLAK